MPEPYQHICPACGKKYDLTDARERQLDFKAAFAFPCSADCAERLWSLKDWLRHMGYGG